MGLSHILLIQHYNFSPSLFLEAVSGTFSWLLTEHFLNIYTSENTLRQHKNKRIFSVLIVIRLIAKRTL